MHRKGWCRAIFSAMLIQLPRERSLLLRHGGSTPNGFGRLHLLPQHARLPHGPLSHGLHRCLLATLAVVFGTKSFSFSKTGAPPRRRQRSRRCQIRLTIFQSQSSKAITTLLTMLLPLSDLLLRLLQRRRLLPLRPRGQ